MKNNFDMKREYAKWFLALSDRLHTFGTFNFRKPHTFDSARRKALRFRRLTNETAYGRRFREHGKELTTAIVIEMKRERPHIHMLQEENPNLKPELEVYKKLWKKASKGWFSDKAIRVEIIESKEAACKYISKEITDDTPPIISLPKERKRIEHGEN